VEEAARQSSILEQGKQFPPLSMEPRERIEHMDGVMTKTVHGSVDEAADPWTAIYCAEERAQKSERIELDVRSIDA
jgi:hypothetical protein